MQTASAACMYMCFGLPDSPCLFTFVYVFVTHVLLNVMRTLFWRVNGQIVVWHMSVSFPFELDEDVIEEFLVKLWHVYLCVYVHCVNVSVCVCVSDADIHVQTNMHTYTHM